MNKHLVTTILTIGTLMWTLISLHGQVDQKKTTRNLQTPKAVNIEFQWGDWIKGNFPSPELDQFKILFRNAIKQAGFVEGDHNNPAIPRLRVSLDGTGLVTFVGGGGTQSSVQYKLSFVTTSQAGQVLFEKRYKGTVLGGSGKTNRKEGNVTTTYLGVDVTAYQLRNDIANKLKSDPL